MLTNRLMILILRVCCWFLWIRHFFLFFSLQRFLLQSSLAFSSLFHHPFPLIPHLSHFKRFRHTLQRILLEASPSSCLLLIFPSSSFFLFLLDRNWNFCKNKDNLKHQRTKRHAHKHARITEQMHKKRRTLTYTYGGCGDAQLTVDIASSRLSVNTTDKNGKTALHSAARWGHTESVKALLASGVGYC
jgi:ankyrin repeat protein